MTQLNIHMTTSFEQELQQFMRVRHITTKAEAVRTAIKEGLEHAASNSTTQNFQNWLGLATTVPPNKNNKFQSDDDLWK